MAEPAEGTSANQQEQPFLDLPYLYGTWTGRLKIAEFFTSLLAGALVPGTVYEHAGAFGFVSFICWTTFIFVIFDIILHLVRLWDRLIFVHTYPQVLVCLCFLGAVSFGVGGILELALSKHAKHPGLGYASAVFVIACGTLLAIECLYHYRNYRDIQQGKSVEMSSHAAADQQGQQDPNNFY